MLRKQPSQGRSRNTFSCIVEAASKLIAESDIPNVNTKSIAAKAGVSIGSLYQYFGNKEAIFDELSEEIVTRKFRTFQLAIQESNEISIEGFLECYINSFLSFFKCSQNVRTKFFLSRPQRLLEKVIPLEEELLDITLEKIANVQNIDPRFNHREVAFLIVYTINNLFRRTILGKQVMSPEQIKIHLMGMLTGYLICRD